MFGAIWEFTLSADSPVLSWSSQKTLHFLGILRKYGTLGLGLRVMVSESPETQRILGSFKSVPICRLAHWKFLESAVLSAESTNSQLVQNKYKPFGGKLLLIFRMLEHKLMNN